MKNIVNTFTLPEKSEDEVWNNFIDEIINCINNRGFYLSWEDQIESPEGGEYDIDDIIEATYGWEPENWHIHLWRDGIEYLLFAKDLAVTPKLKKQEGVYYICELISPVDNSKEYQLTELPIREYQTNCAVTTLFSGTLLQCLKCAKIFHIDALGHHSDGGWDIIKL